MSHHPHIDRSEIFRLLPLALLFGSVGGLLAGALSSHLPELRDLGAQFGRAATLLGALASSLIALWLLTKAQRRALEETEYRFEEEALVVAWPGHEQHYSWGQFEAIDRIPGGLHLRGKSGQSCQLFGLMDIANVEQSLGERLARGPIAPMDAPNHAA